LNGEMDKKLLMFETGGQYLAVPLLKVSGIYKVPGIHRLPLSPPFLKGVTILKGHVIPIIDLKRFLYGEETSPRLMLSLKEEEPIALLVDRVIGIGEPEAISPLETRFVEGDFKMNGSHYGFLNTKKLFEEVKKKVFNFYRGTQK